MTRERYNRILRTIKTAMYAGGGFDDLTFQRAADAVWAIVEPWALDVTVDGVPIVPGMTVYIGEESYTVHLIGKKGEHPRLISCSNGQHYRYPANILHAERG